MTDTPHSSDAPTLALTDEGDYLRIEAHGKDIQRDALLKVWSDIADASARTGHTRILVVNRIRNKASLEDIKYLVESPLFDRLAGASIAMVSPRDRLVENEFGIYLAGSKAINARYFESSREAEAWLLEQPR